MNTEKGAQVPETTKRIYQSPELVALGAAKDITRNVNELGGGDAIFSLLRHS